MDTDDKIFKTIEEQVQILESRNLLFLDRNAASQSLQKFGYYEIINGYKDIFLNDPTDDSAGYKPNITFEHIFNLYNLDKTIRNEIRSVLDDFELILKQNLSYVIAENISEQHSVYTDKSNFSSGKLHKYKERETTDRDTLLKEFKKATYSKEEPFNFYIKTHANIPPWIMVKNFSFGNTIYWYKLSDSTIKDKIVARMFGIPYDFFNTLNPPFNLTNLFGDLLNLYLDYRNACSHGKRIYNMRSKKLIRTYSPVLYDTNSLKVSKTQFNNGQMRSSLGILIESMSLFRETQLSSTALVTVAYVLEKYFEKFPDDLDFLLPSIEAPDKLSMLIHRDK